MSPPLSTPRTRTGRRTRTTSLLLAAAVTLISAGVVLYFVVTGQNAAMRGGFAGNGGPGPTPRGPIAPPVSGDDLNHGPMQGTGKARIQFVDKRDPTRVASELEYEQLDPLAKGRYSVRNPQTRVFFRDGRVLYVRAASGKLKMPPGGQEPESGEFHGGVVARLFEAPRSAGGAPRGIDPERDTPLLLASMDSLSFDRATALEFSTPDRVSLSTPDGELQGVGLRVVYDEVGERPALVEVKKRELLHLRQKADGTVAEAKNPAPTGDNVSPSPAGGPVVAAPKEDLYAADLPGGVELVSRGQTIAAERLELWARLINGKLSPGAIAGVDSGPSKRAAATGPATTGIESEPTTAPASIAAVAPPATNNGTPSVPERIAALRALLTAGLPAPLTPVGEDDAILAGQGGLVIAPIEAGADELKKDDLALRFSSPGAGGRDAVTMADHSSGAGGNCAVLDYGATSRSITMSGPGIDGFTLRDGKGGKVAGEHLTIDLGTGLAQIAGAGSGRDARGQSVVWTDQAEFDLLLGQAGGGTNPEIRGLREARITGGVVASDGQSTLTGDFQRVWFTPAPGPPGGGSTAGRNDSILSRLVVEGHARGAARKSGSDEDEDWLKADRMDVQFKPSVNGRDAAPTVLTATGSVEGQRGEDVSIGTDDRPPGAHTHRLRSTLRGGFLEANLSRDVKNHVAVASADVHDHAHFERTDGVIADGDDLHVEVAEKTADLRGSPATVSSGPSRITGSLVRMDGRENGLAVDGAGTFDYTPPPKGAVEIAATDGPTKTSKREPGPVHVTWTKSMRFINKEGLVECVGEAVAVSHPDELTVDTVHGERIVLNLAPKENTEGGPAPGLSVDVAELMKDRELVSAEIIGQAAEAGETPDLTDPSRLAQVESRRYVLDAAAPEGRRLERLLYMAGGRIIADNRAGTTTVPGPGRALVLDNRAEDPPKPGGAAGAVKAVEPALPLGVGGRRGASLFEWEGSLTFDRAAGLLTLDRGVRLSHKPLGNESPIRMWCDYLEAHLDETTGAKPPDVAAMVAGKEQLVRAIARGTVSVENESGQIQLNADELDYDAVAGTIIASGLPGAGERATLMDKRRATPLVGRKLKWDIKRDTQEVIEPMPISAPLK